MYQLNKPKDHTISSVGKISWGILLVMVVPHLASYCFKIWIEAKYFTNIRLSNFGNSWSIEWALFAGLFTQFIISYILFLSILLYFVRTDRLPTYNYIWHFNFSKYWYGGAIVIGCALGCAYYFGMFTLTGKPYGALTFSGGKSPHFQMILIFIFLFTVLPPIPEELFFRGICYNIFRRYFGIIPSMTVSSLLFTIWHPQLYYDNYIVAIAIFPFGVIQCFLLERLRSIIPLVIIHAVGNFVIGFLTNILRPMTYG